VDFEPIFFFAKTQKYHFAQQLEPYSAPSGRWGGDQLKALGSSRWAESVGQGAYRSRNMRPNPAGRNMRTTWAISTRGFKGEHFAAYPEALAERMVRAACPEGGVVLDPFMGAGTTAVVARKLGRRYIGVELNPEYVSIANRRLRSELGLFQ
jgi:site-specific DNA-methyltransferase (adenine-specific)